ncbi:hypothetical protein MN608_03728 [Microdochium nivale]|nr:hypothetical protein MN608_03728 [Microdochium nivale]
MEQKAPGRSDHRDARGSAPASNGKEKETYDTAQPSVTTTDSGRDERTLGARVVASASRLASDLVTSPANASDMSKAMPANKSHSNHAAAGSSSSVISSHTHDLQAAGSSSLHPAASSGHSFRTTDTQGHAAQQEAAFSSFLDSIPALKPPPETVTSSLEPRDDQASRQPAPANAKQPAPFGSAGTRCEAAAPVQDGLEVVRLLESDAYEEVMAETAEDEPILTSEERASLRRALFGNVQHSTATSTSTHSIDWDDLLNFVPSYVTDNGAQGVALAVGDRQRVEHFGRSETGESQRNWAEQWAQVLTRYTDEVWGDLSSLVHEAQREVQDAEDGARPVAAGGPSEFPALRRLQQILGQIRGF